MEFPRELCQAELAALPSPRSGIRQVRGAAQPPIPPPPGEPLIWPIPAALKSRPAGFITREGEEPRVFSAPARPCPGSGEWQLGALGGAEPRLPSRPVLFAATGTRGPGPGELSSLRVAETRGSPRQRRDAGGSGPRLGVLSAGAGFLFCFEAGVGEGQHLVNEKFPVRKTPLAVSVLPLN